MEGFNLEKNPRFKTPQEELDFLRKHLKEKEKALADNGIEANKEILSHEIISQYKEYEPKEVMHKDAIIQEKFADNLVLRLHPEPHDNKMEELLGVLLSKGISNTMVVLKKLNNPHIDDDFHRFLVQYLYTTHKIPGLKENTPIFKSLDMKLFEITLPDATDSEENKKPLKELLSAMEQFYAGMHSVGEGRNNINRNHFTLEIALSEGTDHFIFYTAVPTNKAELFEKQLLGIHLNAKISEVPDDYNIFSKESFVKASYAKLDSYEFYPIKTYDSFDHDPLNIILNIFTKLKKEGEGAAIQLTLCPEDDEIIKKYKITLMDVKDGMSVNMAGNTTKQIFGEIGNFVKHSFGLSNNKKEEKKVDEKIVENINEKIKSTIMSTNIRIITSAKTEIRAETILSNIESSFNQFTEAGRNGFKFYRPVKSSLATLIHDFSYRMFSDNYAIPLNLKELATVFHFPYGVVSSQLKQAKAGIASAPLDISNEGILLGVNNYRDVDTEIHINNEDRMRHMYVIGQTGTGKTTLLEKYDCSRHKEW